MEHAVYFAIVGFDHDPSTLDQILDYPADDYWRKGDSFSAAMPEARRRENRWIVSSMLDEDARYREHFGILLEKLKQLAPKLDKLDDDYRYGIGVAHYQYVDDPAFYLPEEMIEDFRELGLAMTFDQLGIENGAGN